MPAKRLKRVGKIDATLRIRIDFEQDGAGGEKSFAPRRVSAAQS